MKIVKTKIQDLLILKSQIYRDNRGFLKETFRKNVLKKDFPFDITTLSKKKCNSWSSFSEEIFTGKVNNSITW